MWRGMCVWRGVCLTVCGEKCVYGEERVYGEECVCEHPYISTTTGPNPVLHTSHHSFLLILFIKYNYTNVNHAMYTKMGL